MATVLNHIDERSTGDGDGRVGPIGGPVHRLTALDRRSQLIAACLAVALLLAPAIALLRAQDAWVPSGDNALIALRARDVGTARSPLIGQPSTSGSYGQDKRNVAHLGPIEFYLLAVPDRLFGTALGMLTTAAAIVGASVLLSAWLVFRQLGSAAGLIAALALAAVMFTTGASSLINPISSSIAGYPLLCTVVLCWCLVCGDHRMLPLATFVASFTAQQHLSVVTSAAVVGLFGVAGLVISILIRRRGFAEPWRDVRRSVLLSAGVAAVVWFPVILQQLVGHPGNLSALVSYGTDRSVQAVGLGAGARQLVHALAVIGIIGRPSLNGTGLLASVPSWEVIAAVVATALVALVGWRSRRAEPRLALLAVMAGPVAVAGLVTGANVPSSFEQNRLPFYHWAFALAFVVMTVIGVGVSRLLARRRVVMPSALAFAAVLLVAVPAVVNPHLDRLTNRISAVNARVSRQTIDTLVARTKAGARLSGPVGLVVRGGSSFDGLNEAVAARLIGSGVDIVLPELQRGYVNDQRVIDPATVQSGLLLVIADGHTQEVPAGARLVAKVDAVPGFDRTTYQRLVAQARRAGTLELGPDLDQAISAFPSKKEGLVRAGVGLLPSDAASMLLNKSWLELLAAHPPARPRFDPRQLDRLRESFPEAMEREITALDLSIYRLSRRQLLALST